MCPTGFLLECFSYKSLIQRFCAKQVIKENGVLSRLIAIVTDVPPPPPPKQDDKKSKKDKASSRAGTKTKVIGQSHVISFTELDKVCSMLFSHLLVPYVDLKQKAI